MNEFIEKWKPAPGSMMATVEEKREAAETEIQRLQERMDETENAMVSCRLTIKGAGAYSDVDELARAIYQMPALERIYSSQQAAIEQAQRQMHDTARSLIQIDGTLTDLENHVRRSAGQRQTDYQKQFDNECRRLLGRTLEKAVTL